MKRMIKQYWNIFNYLKLKIYFIGMIEKICCMRCNKYRKLKNPKKSNILDKTLVFSIIFKDSSIDEKIFQ